MSFPSSRHDNCGPLFASITESLCLQNESLTGPLEDLELRHVGVLTIKIVEARNLPAADNNGYSDPTLEFWTRPERKSTTAVIKKTLNPTWDDEVHHLLIQVLTSPPLSLF